MNFSLYEISAQYKSVLELIASEDLPDEVIKDTLEGIEGALELKANNVMMFVKNLEGLTEQLKAEEERMKKRRVSLENKALKLNDYLLSCMVANGISKITCPNFELILRNNPVSVEIFNEKLIPEEFMVQQPSPPPKPNKAMIKEAIHSGREVDGAVLKQGKRLEIK